MERLSCELPLSFECFLGVKLLGLVLGPTGSCLSETLLSDASDAGVSDVCAFLVDASACSRPLLRFIDPRWSCTRFLSMKLMNSIFRSESASFIVLGAHRMFDVLDQVLTSCANSVTTTEKR